MPVETRSPTTTYVISLGWNNPTYTFSSDNLRASCAITWAKQGYRDYGFTFPAGTIINKVEIGCEGYTDIAGDYIRVSYSVDAGATWTIAGNQGSLTEVLTYWDRTADRAWTPDHLSNANFRVMIYAHIVVACLHPETPIVMWDGSRKKIREMNVGDEVKSWDEKEGICKGVVEVVTMHKGKFKLRKIWYKCPEHEKEEFISLTPNHRVYSGKNLVEVKELKEGDMLNHYVKSGDMIIPIPILKIEEEECDEVWNIQTKPERFFVGHRTILIHNEIKW